jgi:hypothetical protein
MMKKTKKSRLVEEYNLSCGEFRAATAEIMTCMDRLDSLVRRKDRVLSRYLRAVQALNRFYGWSD